MALRTVTLLALLGVAFGQFGNNYKRVCYYTNWSQYRPSPGKFVPENIDPTLCTHISFAFAILDPQGTSVKPFEWNDDDTSFSKGMYSRMMENRVKNPSVLISLAVGGWNFGSEAFSKLVADPTKRRQFVDSAVQFLRARNFDGLDLDWEYPNNRGGAPADKDNIVLLAQELRGAFIRDAQSTGKPKLLLSAAVAAGEPTVLSGYDVPRFSEPFDFINLMAYDLHGAWENVTGINAPLFPSGGPNPLDVTFNLAYAAELWVGQMPLSQQAAFRKKMTIGVALYGRSFTLVNPADNCINSPARDAGRKGTYTRESGFYAYYEICEMINQGAQTRWDEAQQVPYLVYGDQWVGYDNERSLRQKVRWMKEKGFGGIMMWAIDLDSFNGQCNGQSYPLMRAVNSELNANTRLIPIDRNQIIPCNRPVSPQVTQPPVTSPPIRTLFPPIRTFFPPIRTQPPIIVTNPPTQQPPTRPPPTNDICQGRLGILPDPYSCTIFHQCVPGGYRYTMNCPAGLFYMSERHLCNWPQRVLDCTFDGRRKPDP